MITQEQVEFYRENGYIMVENLADAAALERMREVIRGYVDKASGIKDHDDIYDLEPGHTPERPRVRRIKKPHVVDPVFMEVLTSPAMMEVSRALLGPNIRLYGSKLNMKSPYYGSPVEWHQDWAFYPHTNDDVLAVGVAIDAMTLENGCLMVVPGSHEGPVHDHHQDGYFAGAVQPDGMAEQAVPIELGAGDISIPHARFLPASAPTRSARPRRFLLFEYAAADAWPLVGFSDWQEFNSRLLSG